ncbi:hypothetical protein [Methylotuvimicrobium sp.]|uniref:hypothetical protein n=1 Tax=Methylotuvimicrobium sp. TaxID=2822413 RepID=UPI003D6523C0
MALAQEDINYIESLIRKVLAEQLDQSRFDSRYDLELRERTIRVEEELKHQRELMLEGFKQMEKRFEQVDKRFEQVEKRFEQIDKRFEQVEKRFEQIDKRFEQIDKRFEQVDKHLIQITTRMDRFMFWSLGLTISAVIAVLKFM